MDGPNKHLFNLLRIVGPLIFFGVILAVLYFMTDLGLYVSIAIAATVAVVDFWILTVLMGRLAGPGE